MQTKQDPSAGKQQVPGSGPAASPADLRLRGPAIERDPVVTSGTLLVPSSDVGHGRQVPVNANVISKDSTAVTANSQEINPTTARSEAAVSGKFKDWYSTKREQLDAALQPRPYDPIFPAAARALLRESISALNPRYIISALNPRYVVQQFRETRQQLKAALQASGDDKLRAHPEAVADVMKLRMKAGLAISEIVGTYICAPALSLAMQYGHSGSVAKGIAGEIIGDYFPAVLTSTIVWGLLNKAYYKNSSDNVLGKLKQLVVDRAPFVWNGLKAAAPVYALSAAAGFAYLAVGKVLFPAAVDVVPAFPIVQVLNGVVGQAIFMMLVLRRYDDLAAGITNKYRSYLERTAPAGSEDKSPGA